MIPTSTVERVLDPLLTAGRVERGWLGVALHPVALLDPVRTEAGQDRGLMVMQTAPDGPAAKAGVLSGDILVALGGTPASRPRELAPHLGPESIGKQVPLKIVRSGKVHNLNATITARSAR